MNRYFISITTFDFEKPRLYILTPANQWYGVEGPYARKVMDQPLGLLKEVNYDDLGCAHRHFGPYDLRDVS